MKFLNSRNGVLIVLLVGLLVVSFFWIVRSEIRAASLLSRLDEHHEQLKKNSDELDNLNTFMRRVGNNLIYIDKNMLQLGTGKSSLFFKGDIFTVEMRSGKLVLELSEPDKLVQLINESSKIKLSNDKIIIEAKGDISIGPSQNKSLGYRKNEDYIYMVNGESRIVIGDTFDKDGNPIGKGLNLISKTGGPYLTVGQDKIMLNVPSKDGHYKLWIDPTQQLVGMKQGESEIIMRKDEITIEAAGDINITSKNGKVNINGKR